MQKAKLFYIKILLLSVFSFFLSHYGYGQENFNSAHVRSLFPKETKNIWINYLSGKLADVHTIDMILGTDGNIAKGIYKLRSSDTYFSFEGEEKDEALRLIELNENSKYIAHIDGTYNGQVLNGQWVNHDSTIILPLRLGFVNNFEDYIDQKVIQNQWKRSYAGSFNGVPIRLEITKNDSIYEILCIEQEKYWIQASQNQNQSIYIKIDKKNSILENKWLYLDSINQEKIDIIDIDFDGSTAMTSLFQDNIIQYKPFEYADYHSRLESLKPDINNKKFDEFMDQKFKDWLYHSVKKLKSTTQNDVATIERWIQTAYGWVEVYIMHGDLISGMIYLQASWINKTEKIPFIFDLKTNKGINTKEIFDPKFDSNTYFRNLVPGLTEEIPGSTGLKNWIKKQNFDHVCLKENGISFGSDFSTIFGEKEVLIPYKELEKHIKPKYKLIR